MIASPFHILTPRFIGTATLIVWVLVSGQPASAGPLSKDDALSTLRNQVTKDTLYPQMECVNVFVEEESSKSFTVAIRENHNPHCGGDPDVAPVIDRFRISRTKKTIEWYDVIDDDYRPYAEAVERRKQE